MLDLSTRPTRDTLARTAPVADPDSPEGASRDRADPDARPRLDFYGPIHKALRAFLFDTAMRVGAMDPAHRPDRASACEQVLALMAQMRSHLTHENTFVHAALEGRDPRLSADVAAEHLHHETSIADLETLTCALRDADAARAGALAGRLYRHLSEFIAENLVHMQYEETVMNARLWSMFSDAELTDLHDRLLASIAPDEMALTLHWFCRSLSVTELTGLFGEMREAAPPEVFVGSFEIARAQMAPARLSRLAGALGVWPLPGEVSDPASTSAA